MTNLTKYSGWEWIPNKFMIVRCEDKSGCKQSNLRMYRPIGGNEILCRKCAIQFAAKQNADST